MEQSQGGFCDLNIIVAVFDFLSELGYGATKISRLELRHRFLVDAVAREIRGAKVLDLGCHDGRWTYAYARAGARHVVGVEGRPELLDRFGRSPHVEGAKIELRPTDLFRAFDDMKLTGERFDVVACLGVLYHVADHFRLLSSICSLNPRLVIVDSLFDLSHDPVTRYFVETTDNEVHAVADRPTTVVGRPSRAALTIMARNFGYGTSWAEWDLIPTSERIGIAEYYPDDRDFIRDTAYLRIM